MTGCVTWADVTPNSGAWADIDICAVSTPLMSEQTYYVNSKKLKIYKFGLMKSTQTYYVNSKKVKITLGNYSVNSAQSWIGNGKKLKIIKVV